MFDVSRRRRVGRILKRDDYLITSILYSVEFADGKYLFIDKLSLNTVINVLYVYIL